MDGTLWFSVRFVRILLFYVRTSADFLYRCWIFRWTADSSNNKLVFCTMADHKATKAERQAFSASKADISKVNSVPVRICMINLYSDSLRIRVMLRTNKCWPAWQGTAERAARRNKSTTGKPGCMALLSTNYIEMANSWLGIIYKAQHQPYSFSYWWWA